MELYTATWKRNEKIEVDGFETPVSIPDRPPRRLMFNYGKTMYDQRYERTSFPVWENLTFAEKKALVDRERHRRLNGEWWLIKGNEIYVPGWAHFYFNYWWCEFGSLPDFRIEAVEYFQVWDHCFRDSRCFGLFDIKGRRAGDTEKALCTGYDMCTRFSDSWFAHQNIKDEDAEGNFLRVLNAHNRMQPWFRPISLPGDRAAIIMEFPSDRTVEGAMARSMTKAADSRGLMSRIDYRPTKLAEYDGKRLRYYYMDEPGKLDSKKMDIEKQWGIIRPCLSLHNQQTIIGKAAFTTTVENIKSGASIDACRRFWESSNPMERMSNGRTESGLYRYFRNFIKGAEVDEYGYPNVKKAIDDWNMEIASYLSKNDLEGLSAFKRRFPKDIDDALSTPATDCPLFPEMLDAQMQHLRRLRATGMPHEIERLERRGDLVWESGFGGNVKWVPNETSGKWCITIHPDSPNARVMLGGRVTPGNHGLYTIGVDPIDHKTAPGVTYSKGSIVVYRPFNPVYESSEIYDEEGNVVFTDQMKTDRVICTYKNRPPDPFVFYEDVLKTVIYYGVQAFIEHDKPGVLSYMQNNGFGAYLAFKPKTIGVGVTTKHPGAKTSGQLINVFVPMIQSHIANRLGTYYHVDLLQDYRNFTGDNTKKCDLLVAMGYALMIASPIVAQNKRKERYWKTKPF